MVIYILILVMLIFINLIFDLMINPEKYMEIKKKLTKLTDRKKKE